MLWRAIRRRPTQSPGIVRVAETLPAPRYVRAAVAQVRHRPFRQALILTELLHLDFGAVAVRLGVPTGTAQDIILQAQLVLNAVLVQPGY